MRMPQRSTSARRLLQFFGVYLLARLGVHPETAALSAAWKKGLDALKAALGVSEAASERQVLARAAIDFADLSLDNAVRSVAAAARVDLGGRAEGPDWERLFHTRPGDVVRLPVAEVIEEAKRIESELSSGAVWKAAKAVLPALKAARESLEKANASYRAAVVESETMDRKLADAVADWRRAYRAVFGGLTERFPGNRSLVDSFFWQETDRSEDTTAAPAVPAPATT